MISLRSARTATTRSWKACGPGFVSASTPAQDDQQLDAFLKRLGRRPVHLRPSIEVRRIWPWPHAVDLDRRGALASEVRTAVTELLTALDETLPPACTDKRLIAT